MNKATAAQPARNEHGALTVITSLVETGVHFLVSDGVQRIDELSKTFADRAQAAAYYRHLAGAAEQGKRIHQIVWEIQALEEAQNAATGRTEDEILAGLQADVDADHKLTLADHDHAVQLVADALAGPRESYRDMRERIRKQVMAQANQRTLDQVVPQREGRTVRPTKSGVFRKPLDPAQIRAIALHRGGVVHQGNGVSRPTLAALADKGYGTVNYQPGMGRRRVIESVTLNAAGLAVADQQGSVAA